MAKDAVNDILNQSVSNDQINAFLANMGLKESERTNRNAIIVSMTNAAIKGDTRAALWLLEHSEADDTEIQKTALQVIQERKRERAKAKPKTTSNRKSTAKNKKSK